MSIRTEIRHSRNRAVKRLLALRDEAKLQAHLLSLDTQRDFARLEREIVTLEQRASRDTEQAVDSIKSAAQELGRALKDLVTTQLSDSAGLLTSVRSLMNAPAVTCTPEDTLSAAAHLMWNQDCGAIPIVSGDKPVGVVTDRDVCMAAYTQGKPLCELRVGGAMSKQLYGCGPDESIGAALGVMSEQRVQRLPVVSSDGQLVGMLSLADIVRWARDLTNPAVHAAIVDALGAISSPPQVHAVAAE